MTFRPLIAAAAAVLVTALTLPAIAQNPPPGQPARLRGTIDAVNGNVISITTREGEKIDVNMADNFSVRTPTPLTLADIGPDDFIGAAAFEGEGGKLDAIEVLVFPEALKANKPGEGHYPWDLEPNSNMTNAAVTTVTPEGEGILVDVQYKDGTKQILITPDIPVWTFVDGTTADLQPGKYVFIGARKLDDGTYTAPAVTVEANGMKPPN
jgi:hypothetical protein